jgi:hypothetical protein
MAYIEQQQGPTCLIDTTTHVETHLLQSADGKPELYEKVIHMQSSSSSTMDDLYLEETHSLPAHEEHGDVVDPNDSLSSSPQRYDTMVGENLQQLQSYKDKSAPLPQGFYPIISFVLVTFFLFLYPNIRTFTSYGQFYQKNIETWNQESIRAVCLAGYGSMVSIQDRITQTQNISQQPLFLSPNQFIPQTAQLILWSEESWYVETLEEEEYIFQQVGKIANTSNVTIGVGYRAKILSNSSSLDYSYRNMFILVNTQGQVVLKYQKVHPVPGIEDNIEPGKHRPPLIQMESLPGVTMGAAICFDFDFPSFIQKTTRGHASGSLIMLQPGTKEILLKSF